MLPAILKKRAEEILNAKSHKIVLQHGGCISESAILITESGPFFIKWNSVRQFPDIFETEARGLQLLKSFSAFPIPRVIATERTENFCLIIMDYIPSSSEKQGFWEEFGFRLAELHRVSSGKFGLDYNNYIGSLPQLNTSHTSWNSFFRDCRLQPQLEKALSNSVLDNSLIFHFENLYKRLDELFPDEPDSLLHGDLWNGNYIVNNTGSAALIDPSVYYGFREMDLAMTHLFGGFHSLFYDAYQEAYPLQTGWEERVDICNLYPLLVHANLFGGSYGNEIKRIITKF